MTDDTSKVLAPTTDQMSQILERLAEIEKLTGKVNSKINRRYTDEDLERIKATVKKRRETVVLLYDSLVSREATTGTTELKENAGIYKEIESALNEREARNRHLKLFEEYNKLHYNFRTARMLTKNCIQRETLENGSYLLGNTGNIILFKNVRIMEDLIHKICINNIDKTIVSGEQHFDSIRYGFEWLFCHEELGEPGDQTRRGQLDIRDSNRYLDYLKYQIMCSSSNVDPKCAPRSSTEIDLLAERIKITFNRKNFEDRSRCIEEFKNKVKQIILDFSNVYEALIKYRDALLLEEEIRKSLEYAMNTADDPGSKAAKDDISSDDLRKVINLSSVAVRVMLDRFVSFVKISDLNFGNSTFYRAWFNYSELSKSNYAGSNFKYARIENAKMKDCDISTCNLILVDGGHTDFSHSNFNYSNMTGINLVDATVNYCEFQNAVFLDPNIGLYRNAILKIAKDKERYEETTDAISRYNSLKRLSYAWCNEEESGLTASEEAVRIAEQYKEMSLPSLDVKEANDDKTWCILYAMPDESSAKAGGKGARALARSIGVDIRKLLKRLLSIEISADLMSGVRDLIANESPGIRKDRIKDEGDILLEVADMTNISAKHAMLGESNLSHVKMENASFENADMSGVRMHYTTGRAASFISANLNHADCFESNYYLANFSRSVINDTHFINCNLNHTNWNYALLVGTVFLDASSFLENAVFEEDTQDQSFIIQQCIKIESERNRLIQDCPDYKDDTRKGAEYTKLDMKYWQTDCSIKDSSFEHVLADSTVFININADRSEFSQASLRNSIWANCRAYLAHFINADLRYSRMTCCCMGQSNFSKANIVNAILSYVDFNRCNLTKTLFNRCKMNHVLIQNAAVEGLNLSEAEVDNSAFEDCKFTDVIIAGATFRNCVFHNIEFKGVKGFHSSEYKDCIFHNCLYDNGKTEYGRPILLDGKINPRELVE